jgi:hypothetical protein
VEAGQFRSTVKLSAEFSDRTGRGWQEPGTHAFPPVSSFGSSGVSGENRSYLEEEVGVVSEAVSHSFDDFDLVIDALEKARMRLPGERLGNGRLVRPNDVSIYYEVRAEGPTLLLLHGSFGTGEWQWREATQLDTPQ